MLHRGSGYEQTVFRLFAPGAVAVWLELSDQETYTERPMERSLDPESPEVFELFLDGDFSGARYHFRIRSSEGKDLLRSDPYGAFFPDPAGMDAEVVREPLSPGTDAEAGSEPVSAGPEAKGAGQKRVIPGYDRPMAIYEVHPGSFLRREDGSAASYEELARELIPYVKGLGFTAIELMGIAEYPSDASWGYQVRGFYAPTSRYGTPSGFSHLVEAAHQAGLLVILDWVGGHFSLEPGSLSLFCGAPFYEQADENGNPRMTGWGSAPFDYENPYVRSFLIDNALFWKQVYGVDGLRVDAVSVMLYGDPVSRGQLSLQEMNEYWAREAASRSLKPGTGSGYYGASAAEDTEPAVSASIFEPGEPDEAAIRFLRELTETLHREGADMLLFAEDSSAYPGVTKSCAEGGLGFDYKWDLGWTHDLLSFYGADALQKKEEACHRQVTFPMMYRDSEEFLLPLSHDEVVYGKRSLLSKAPFGDEGARFNALKTFLSFWIGHPGKKLLFMGQELGLSEEWDYTSAIFEGHVPKDSLSVCGFDALRSDFASFFRDLMTLYRKNPVLWRFEDPQKESVFEHFRWLRTEDTEHGIFAFARFAPGERSLIWIFHFQEDTAAFTLPVPEEGVYRKVLDQGGSLAGKGIMHPTGPDEFGRPALELTMSGLGLAVYEWNCRGKVLLTDTHAHYDDHAFDPDREELLSDRLLRAGVGRIVNISAAFPSLEDSVALAEQYDYVYAAVGLHPSDVRDLRDLVSEGREQELMTKTQFEAWQAFLALPEESRRKAEEILGEYSEKQENGLLFYGYLFTGREREILDHTLDLLLQKAAHPKVVAIGEIGLDYHWHEDDLPAQKAWFAAQILVAKATGLPIVIHSRDAAQDTLELLRGMNAGSLGGVMHCYSYKWEMALEYVKMGFLIGVGGSATYGRAKRKKGKLYQVIREVPLEHLVLETDAPYQTPESHRGERNDSSLLWEVADYIAEIKGGSAEEVAEAAAANALRLYPKMNKNRRFGAG